MQHWQLWICILHQPPQGRQSTHLPPHTSGWDLTPHRLCYTQNEDVHTWYNQAEASQMCHFMSCYSQTGRERPPPH